MPLGWLSMILQLEAYMHRFGVFLFDTFIASRICGVSLDTLNRV